MGNKPNRKYKRVYAYGKYSVFFEMENGYYYLVDITRDKIDVFFNPMQYEKFVPYLEHDGNVPPELLKKAEKALQTLPALNHSRHHIHETNL